MEIDYISKTFEENYEIELSENREYYIRLGRFTQGYAIVEQAIREMTLTWSGLGLEVALAIMGGIPTSEMVNILKRLPPYKALSKDNRAILLDALKQLAELSDDRHKIIHQQHDPGAYNSFITCNHFSAKTPEQLYVRQYRLKELDLMIVDLFFIQQKILWILYQSNSTRNPSNSGWLINRVLDCSFSSWQYKPPPQDEDRKRKNAMLKRRSRPLPPS
jgi:hypothetical protein